MSRKDPEKETDRTASLVKSHLIEAVAENPRVGNDKANTILEVIFGSITHADGAERESKFAVLASSTFMGVGRGLDVIPRTVHRLRCLPRA